MNLTAKLLVVFLLLSITPLSMVGYLAYENSHQSLQQDATDRLMTITLLKEAEFGSWLEDSQGDVRILAERPLIRRYAAALVSMSPPSPDYQVISDDILRDHLSPYLQEQTNFLEFSLVRASDGLTLVATDAGATGEYVADEAYFTEGRKATYIGSVEYVGTTDEQVMHVSTPVIDEQGTVIAVLVGHLNLVDISTIMGRHSGLRETQETYLVNASRVMVTRSLFVPTSELKGPIHTTGVDACLAGQNDTAFYDDYRGVPVIGAYQWIAERQLCIITEIDQSEAMAPIFDLRDSILLIAGMIGLGVAVIAVFFARTITRPVQRLFQGAEAIGQGNLDYRMVERGHDELAQLAKAFNAMAAHRQQDEEALKKHRDHLEELVTERTQALHQRESILRAVLNAPVEIVMLLDHQGNVLNINESAARRFGSAPDALVGRNAYDLLPPEAAQTRRPLIEGVLRSGEPIHFEDSSAGRNYANSVYPVYDEHGQALIGTAIYASDITERKQAEERERHLTAVLRSIRNVNQLIVHEKDPIRLLQDSCNNLVAARGYHTAWIALVDKSGALRTLASAGLDANRTGLEQRLHAGEWVYCTQQVLARPGTLAITDISVACGDCPLVQSKERQGRMSIRLEHDGRVFGVLTVSAPVEFVEASEEHSLLEEIAADIAFALHGMDLEQQRRQMEEALAANYQLLRTLIDSLPDRIYAKDVQGRFILRNEADAHEIGAASAQETIGKTYLDYYPPGLAAQYEAEDRTILQSGQPLINREESVTAPDGTPGWVLTTRVPLRDPQGNVVGLVGIGRDITQRKFREEQLRAERDFSDSLIQTAQAIVLVLDAEGRIIRFNPYMEELSGIRLAEVQGQDWITCFIPEREREEIQTTFEQAIQDIRTRGKVSSIVTRNGQERQIEWYDRTLKDADGVTTGLLSIGLDVTERIRTQQALNESEQRLRIVLDNMPVMLDALDDDLNIVAWNKECERVTGYSADEIVDNPRVAEILYPDPDYRARMLAEMAVRVDYRDWEWEVTCKDGSVRTIAWSNISHQYPVPGWAHWGVGTDITERKRAQQQLRELNETLEQRIIDRTDELNHAKERIEAILNSSSDVMILCRTRGTIDQINPAFDKTFGHTPEEMYNVPLSTLITPEHAHLLEEAFETVVQTGQPARLEVIAQYEDSASFYADVMLSPVIGSANHLFGVICSLRDITSRKQMEEQLRQMLEHEMELSELKSRYVSMAAHDLRNPLAVIQTSASLIRQYGDRLDKRKLEEKYESIQSGIDIMVELLDDILVYEKAESGKLTFEPAPLDVISFCQDMVDEIGQGVHSAGRIEFFSGGDCHPAAMDQKLLRHIIGNLLSNALKYSPDSSAVTFTTHCEPEQIVFRIQDHGIGIPKDDQRRLFETFHRASNTHQIPGTGLGLAIVKQSVELHGGTITFESEEGVGTTFTVVLPALPLENRPGDPSAR